MRNEQYPAERLARLLRSKTIAEMDELKRALGTSVDMTVFRKLRELGYHTSYSHGGRYYALGECSEFDELRLWCFRSVWFSTHGTLLATAKACVEFRSWLLRQRAGIDATCISRRCVAEAGVTVTLTWPDLGAVERCKRAG